MREARVTRGERPMREIVRHLGERFKHGVMVELFAWKQHLRDKRRSRQKEPSDFDLPPARK